MLCGPGEPFDYAIYSIVFRTFGDRSLEHRAGWKVPRIEACCWVVATHHTIPGLHLFGKDPLGFSLAGRPACDFTLSQDDQKDIVEHFVSAGARSPRKMA
jgi:hypothetical protein